MYTHNTYTHKYCVHTNSFDLRSFQLMADGAISTVNHLSMTSRQKTFSIALSRNLSPEARLVAYCVADGTIIADSLTFFVNDTALTEVCE